ncbi:MAG: ABC transporter ATP-binding protein [Bacteroidaceae bacterium]|nr:ABC transporter ATP-binding protein [Bacteroidaceae bacterium]
MMLKIQDVTFAYKKNNPVLDHFSLEINEGGIYGLLGKNGTGKSTLLYLIMGLLRPQSGWVTYNNVETLKRQPELLSDMFIVPEEYNLPGISLQKYINAIQPFYPRFDVNMMYRCLENFEMPRDINLGALSMGQKKKVYLSIALAARTHLLLMDEPTNGLDIPSKSQFRKVVAGSTDPDQIVIISTHQVRDVELLLDHVTMIEKNEVLLNTKMDQLFKDDEVINLEEVFNKLLQEKKGI